MKMRGIKPEFWTDDKTFDVDPVARLLFIGLWTLACDNGHIEDRPRQIKARIFPSDDVDVNALLDQLAAACLITRGDGVVTVPNLTQHQRIDRRFFVTCDLTACSKPDGATAGARRVEPSRSSAPRRVHVEVTTSARRGLDDEGEGEGEGEVTTSSAPLRSADADASDDAPRLDVDGFGTAPLIDLTPQRPAKPDKLAGFDEWYDTRWPGRKVGRAEARKAWPKAVAKVGVDRLNAAADELRAHVRATQKDTTYLKHPSSWLNGERWEDDLTHPGSRPSIDTNWMQL